MANCETEGHIWDGRPGRDFRCEKCGAPYSVGGPVEAKGGDEGYIAVVPDHCDTIAWRGAYHSLPISTDPAGMSEMADDLSLRDRLMIEIAYCRHAEIPVSEEVTRLLAIMSTRTPPVLEVAKEALTDEQVQRALDAFNGGLVRLPDSTNERGYVDWYRPKDAMRAALKAIGAGQ